MKKRLKSVLVNAFKLGLAAGLIFWMVSSGKLDFTQLGLLYQNTIILVTTVLGYFTAFIGLGGLRWFILLKGMGLNVSFARVVHLHYTGMFFNASMPGAVGGDIIKAVYVIRDHQKTSQKTPAMLTILLDRIVGVMGLFLLGFVSLVFNFNSFISNAVLQPIVAVILVFFGFTCVFYLLVFLKIPPEKDPVMRFVNLKVYGFSVLRKIYSALLVYRKRPMTLVYALGLSVLIQCMVMGYFILLTETLVQVNVDAWDFAGIYPVGLFTTALPLAPGGLGVGHVAFEKLFELIGLTNGGNVFNIYVLANLSISMTGFFAFLTIGRYKHDQAPVSPSDVGVHETVSCK